MKFGYEELYVWQRAVDFSVKIIDLIDSIKTSRKHYRLFEQHQKGLVESTKQRRPLELVYYEGFLN